MEKTKIRGEALDGSPMGAAGHEDAGDVQTFAGLWESTTRLYPSRPFLIFGADDGRTLEWTYSEFDSIVHAVADTLQSHGVRHGDGLHLQLRNGPSFVALWLAASRLGAWINPVDPSTGATELAEQLQRTSARLGVCSSDNETAYRSAAATNAVPVLVLPEDPNDLGWTTNSRAGAAADVGRIGPDDRLAVMFTSGTTSRPKGVVLTQANYRVVAREMAKAAELRCTDRWLVTLPLFHANAQYYCFSSAIEVGASVALTERFSASKWVQQAIDLRATTASLFAAPIRMILARTPDKQTPAKLRHVWYAQNLGAGHHAEFGRLAGVLPRQLYGMTETIAVVTTDKSVPPRPDMIGSPLNRRTVRLTRPGSLEPVAVGNPGVISVAGTPGVDLFKEYLDAPDVTARTLVSDDTDRTWLVTGDLAVDNGRGELSFVGRADDVIKVSGENVSLAQLEATIAEAPGVLEAAVVAEVDPVRDHVPVAYVVARPGSRPDPAELSRWAESRLTRASRPVSWHVIDELPRTSVGKIRRFKLTPQTHDNGGR